MRFAFLVHLVFPAHCLSCEKKLKAGALCADCRATIAIYATLFCPLCTVPIPAGQERCCGGTFLFGAAAPYGNESVKKLVHSLKFNFVRSAAEPLAEILAEYAAALPVSFPPSSIVVPVPLSKKRRAERGFNQSSLIGRIFAERMNFRFSEAILERVGHRDPQSGTKNARQRRENVAGCFSAGKDCRATDDPIILIDDVVTSGATLSDAIRALKDAGAKNIYALAAAKA